MDDKIKIEPERSYFFIIPNMVDDMKLSPYAYRLYGHIKRVTGDGGRCYQSTRTLAEACNMSAGSISNAKQELIEAGLISVTSSSNDYNIPGLHTVRVVNIWSDNFTVYSQDEQGERSPHEQERSPHEQERSPGETNKNPLNKNNLIRTDDDDDSTNIYTHYENNIGLLVEVIVEKLKLLEEEYPTAWIIEAIDKAVVMNKRSLAYFEVILKNWKENGKTDGKKNGKDKQAPVDFNKYFSGKYAEFIEDGAE